MRYAARQGEELVGDQAATAISEGSGRASSRRNEGRGDGGAALDRVTVNLNMRASRALELITKLTGDTKTDAINRALQVYAFFEETTAAGGSLYVQDEHDAALQRIKIF